MVIAICDDDRLWNRQASEIIQGYFKEENEPVEILCFEDGDQLLSYRERPISLLFMDIEFDGADRAKSQKTDREMGQTADRENGIDFGRKVNRLWPECQVVYCSNYMNYALDVYDTDHVYYVVKSQFRDRIPQIFKKIRSSEKHKGEKCCFRLIGGELACIPLKNLIYFERKSRYTQIHTIEETYRIKEKISDLLTMVPSGFFTRCHNSYLLNMEHIAHKRGNSYELTSGEEIPVSRGYAKSTRGEFLAWCADYMR